MRGKPLATEEKQFIDTHKDDMSYNYIAQVLAREFKDKNGGYRCQKTVSLYVKKSQAVPA